MENSIQDGFAGLPRAELERLDGAQVAILGAAHGSPYEPGVASHAAGAPAALRKASQLFARQLTQFDFDIGGALQGDPQERRIVDCGDLGLDLADSAANRARITEAVRGILAAGAAPVVLGGDDSVPIPVFAALEGHGPDHPVADRCACGLGRRDPRQPLWLWQPDAPGLGAALDRADRAGRHARPG